MKLKLMFLPEPTMKIAASTYMCGTADIGLDMEFCVSIACGIFVSDCGRICGLLEKLAVEVELRKVFHKMLHYIDKSASKAPFT